MARILVVDDQKISRRTLAGVLGEAGHAVETEGNGPDGIERAREWLPDVIILDVHMPGMGGFDVVERLKEDSATEAIPVVFLTGDPPTDELVVRGLELGAYDFLSKGCSKAELLARVGAMHRIKRSHDELAAIAGLSDALLRSVEPTDLGREFISQALAIFRADAAALAVGRDGRSMLLVHAGFDVPEDRVRAFLAQLGDDIADHEGPATRVLDDDDVSRMVAPHLGQEFSSVGSACAPRYAGETLVAVAAREPGLFRSELDETLLRHLTSQAAVAIEHALLNERARKQARDLERAMSERSRFFASLSHELRTPINAVIGYNDLLQQEIFGAMSDRQQEALGKANRSARHLLELVDDILDISKIEAGKLEIGVEEVDLAALARDTATSLQLQASDKDIGFHIETPEAVPVVTDPARVRQVILNLLSNAVKFTEEGAVTLRVDEADDGGVRITVEDTGPGIAQDDQERIFGEFEQANGSDDGGTGLGLSISRRLAELLGGDLTVESEVGVGSRFLFTLPTEWEPGPDSEWRVGED